MVEKKEMCSSACVEPGVGIVLINIEELYDFNGHPFKVERDQELFELRQSIEREGITVRSLCSDGSGRDNPKSFSGKPYEADEPAGTT